MDEFASYQSPLGAIALRSDGSALTGLWFEGQRHFGGAPETPEPTAGAAEVFKQARSWLDAYFGGRVPDVSVPLALRGTAFRRDVWALLAEIPYGRTTTYGALAEELAKRRGVGRISARAVGGAVGRNPVSLIVPCHRVNGADGSLTGYAAGTERKRALLEMEAQLTIHN